ncbi:insecticidal delta-endotoxin Cry8Ea1 family protein [Myxococcus sp. K15C18031901]|uniref:insecticidal delta-endotoxin Cry8Ea1 family protein n=1 Tax=Myxococcus dinghuensis TaxID=2906761 RepID=UPI0020A79E0D|nr:insecticidal delta-endotoxin Cry8Ea1 family protein [Myxococcus dinghuensis]MCP3104679.1 insecticidal delta-endotoxin Cry8Ea1 family protein [Myxococcus dinghuensis]
MNQTELESRLKPLREAHSNNEDAFNEQLREIANAALGLIPGFGSVLSAIVGLFWRPSGIDLQKFWDAITDWVKDYVEQRLVEEQVQRALDLMNGYRRNLEDADRLVGPEKLNVMASLHVDLNNHANFFLTENNYTNMQLLPTFTPMAVLHIALLSEMVELAWELDNPNAPAWSDILVERSRSYATGGRRAVDHVVPWRGEQVEITIKTIMGGYPPRPRIHLRWHDRLLGKTHFDGFPSDMSKIAEAQNNRRDIMADCRTNFNRIVVDVLKAWDGNGRGALPSSDKTNDPNLQDGMKVLGELVLAEPPSAPK